MVTKPTTFVIGAGASKPHGLPLGAELYKAAKELSPKSNLWQLIRETGVEISTLNNMRADMQTHLAPSIDDYLLTRQQHPAWVQAGKAMIAVLMADAMKSEKTPASEQDWLGKVIGEMSSDAATWEDFRRGNANVRFVTFNFDSIVETRLRREIGYLYPGQTTDLENFLELAIVHVHGTLPSFPNVPIEANPARDLEPLWIKWTKTAGTAINLAHDECDSSALTSAHNAIQQADILCFLGFGYRPNNTRRLRLRELVRSTTEVFGSAFEIGDGDRPRVVARVGSRITLGGSGDDCRRVLEQLHVFRD